MIFMDSASMGISRFPSPPLGKTDRIPSIIQSINFIIFFFFIYFIPNNASTPFLNDVNISTHKSLLWFTYWLISDFSNLSYMKDSVHLFESYRVFVLRLLLKLVLRMLLLRVPSWKSTRLSDSFCFLFISFILELHICFVFF